MHSSFVTSFSLSGDESGVQTPLLLRSWVQEASAVEPLGDALVVKKEPQRLVRTSYRRKKVEKDAAAGGLEPKDDEYGSDSDML